MVRLRDSWARHVLIRYVSCMIKTEQIVLRKATHVGAINYHVSIICVIKQPVSVGRLSAGRAFLYSLFMPPLLDCALTNRSLLTTASVRTWCSIINPSTLGHHVEHGAQWSTTEAKMRHLQETAESL